MINLVRNVAATGPPLSHESFESVWLDSREWRGEVEETVGGVDLADRCPAISSLKAYDISCVLRDGNGMGGWRLVKKKKKKDKNTLTIYTSTDRLNGSPSATCQF